MQLKRANNGNRAVSEMLRCKQKAWHGGGGDCGLCWMHDWGWEVETSPTHSIGAGWVGQEILLRWARWLLQLQSASSKQSVRGGGGLSRTGHVELTINDRRSPEAERKPKPLRLCGSAACPGIPWGPSCWIPNRQGGVKPTVETMKPTGVVDPSGLLDSTLI